MRLTVDLETLQLIASATDRRRVSLVEFKRGDSTPLEVQFVRSGVAEEAVVSGATLTFALKETDKYDGDFVVSFAGFAAPTATPDFISVGTPSLNTVELDALLLKDGNDANDVAYIDLMGELSWTDGTGNNPTSIRTFVARVHNDVIRGDESTPTAQPEPVEWLAANGILFDPAIAELTGGGATRLDGIDTTEQPIPQARLVRFGDAWLPYNLWDSTTDAENSPLEIQPDNWDVSTNAFRWFLANLQCRDLKTFGNIEFQRTASQGINFNLTGLTDQREVTWPDESGTVAFVPELVTESTTARTLALSDASKYIRLTNAAACAITVPASSTAAFPIGSEIFFRIANTGIPTLTLAGGVTVNNGSAISTLVQNGNFALKKVATDTWDFVVLDAITRGQGDARWGRRPVILDADFAKTSDTTPANVPMTAANHPEGLSVFGFSIAANECLTFEAILNVTDASSPRNQRYGLAVPSGCSYQLGLTATGNAGTTASYAFGASDAVVNALVSGTNGGMVHIRGTITNGATAGTVNLTFYQSSSSANTITIKKGSALLVHRP